MSRRASLSESGIDPAQAEPPRQPREQPLAVAGDGRRYWVLLAANLLTCGLFAMCAAVQVNDPDPYVWIPIYAIPAMLALAFVVRPALLHSNPLRWLMVAHCAICLSGLAYLLLVDPWRHRVGKDGNHGNPLAHEEGRESAGLVLVLVWLGAQLCLSRVDAGSCGPVGMLLLLGLLSCLALLPAGLWSACLFYDPDAPDGGGAPAHCVDMARAAGAKARPDL